MYSVAALAAYPVAPNVEVASQSLVVDRDERVERLLYLARQIAVWSHAEEARERRLQEEEQDEEDGYDEGLAVLSAYLQERAFVAPPFRVVAVDAAKQRRDDEPLIAGQRFVDRLSRARPLRHPQHGQDAADAREHFYVNNVLRMIAVPHFEEVGALELYVARCEVDSLNFDVRRGQRPFHYGARVDGCMVNPHRRP